MNFIKKNNEMIIGFAALIFSLGTFKEELASVKLDLLFIHLTLAEYLLGIICGFTICIWFNLMAFAVSGTVAGKSKVFDLLLVIAHKLFMAILYSPFVLGVTIFLDCSPNVKTTSRVDGIITSTLHILTAVAIVRAFVNIYITQYSRSRD